MPHIGDAEHRGILDEQRRELALVTLRKKNFERILDRLDSVTGSTRQALLEVGSAHGWFLDAAARRGHDVHGIEPDAPIAAQSVARGHDVTTGFFPAAVAPDARYDVIVFNDVFEHLPDPRAALVSCRQLLRQGGVLVVNLPSSEGIFFRMATLLDRMGLPGPHERMWQKGFPSPHLSYFRPHTLKRLAAREGFAEIYRGTLDSLDRGGLWQRLRFDTRSSLSGAAIMWLAIMIASPLLARLPSDIALQIYRHAGTRPPA